MKENIFEITERSKITKKKIIEVKNIVVSFKQRKKDISKNEVLSNSKRKIILNKINFHLYQGETLAILGENGAGKTVFIETVVGLNEKDSGEINLNLGHDYYYDDLSEIGVQFQNSLFSKKDRLKNLIDLYKGLYPERVDKDQIEEMLKVFGADKWLNKKVNKLSGGQKQRINLMLAIISNPRVMILDEFVTGLDVNAVAKIISYVNDLKIRNNASMIIISHNPDEIEALADRVLVLKNGSFVEETTIDKIKKKQSVVSYIAEKIKSEEDEVINVNKKEKKKYKGRESL